MSISLKGQRVLVIGAAGGIGHATATVFAQAGADLTAAGRPGPELDAAAVEMGAEPAALERVGHPGVDEHQPVGAAPVDQLGDVAIDGHLEPGVPGVVGDAGRLAHAADPATAASRCAELAGTWPGGPVPPTL